MSVKSLTSDAFTVSRTSTDRLKRGQLRRAFDLLIPWYVHAYLSLLENTRAAPSVILVVADSNLTKNLHLWRWYDLSGDLAAFKSWFLDVECVAPLRSESARSSRDIASRSLRGGLSSP
jgi:hypothetical protein